MSRRWQKFPGMGKGDVDRTSRANNGDGMDGGLSRAGHRTGSPETAEEAQAADAAQVPEDGGTPPPGRTTVAAEGAARADSTDRPGPPYAVVIPTIGRPSLSVLLTALAEARGPRPSRIVLVDDRPPHDPRPLDVHVPPALEPVVVVVPGKGAGPAAARNTGWQEATEPWTVFLDDDVVPGADWPAALAADLTTAGPWVAGVQGRIEVPLPDGRRPTDWERTTAGLAAAHWITADMAYRRSALAASGGFDERFPRAFREDTDLALRLLGAGWELEFGTRRTTHPVRPADSWVSLRAQAGNADDVLMTRRHGHDWWARTGAFRGRLPSHAAVAGSAAAVFAFLAARRPRAAAACTALWLAGTAEFATARIRPGPRTGAEVARMTATSVLIPPVAVGHWFTGQVRHWRVPRWSPPSPSSAREE